LALGVRLFAIWYALVIVREIVAGLTSWGPLYDSIFLIFPIGGSVVALVILLFLWFFPKFIDIAGGPKPRSQ
jgi:hypothetical protein